MESRRRHEGLIWAVILIGVGVIFLLNSLGVLPWSVWGTLLRFWPVILVVTGLQILIEVQGGLGRIAIRRATK